MIDAVKAVDVVPIVGCKYLVTASAELDAGHKWGSASAQQLGIVCMPMSSVFVSSTKACLSTVSMVRTGFSSTYKQGGIQWCLRL